MVLLREKLDEIIDNVELTSLPLDTINLGTQGTAYPYH